MKWVVLIAVALVAFPAVAQRRLDVFIDAEGVRRNGSATNFTGGTRFEPSFQTGGGIGGGFNLFVSNRLSFETKVAGLETKARIRFAGSDFIATADLGWAQIYPISVVMQWHMLEHGTVRPYLGAGAVYTILRNINERVGPSATGIHFDNPTGLVLDGGLEFNLSERWNVLADLRYVPIETKAHATFPGTSSTVDLSVRPAILSFGVGYRF